MHRARVARGGSTTVDRGTSRVPRRSSRTLALGPRETSTRNM